MENKIPTAEELFKYYADHTALSEGHYDYLVNKEDFIEALQKFAKLHVEQALKEASEDANMDSDYYQALQVYPLTNIK
jgi:hypothetical protein